ncbi:unnamed protein product, partial [Tetraodon nigroviridis]
PLDEDASQGVRRSSTFPRDVPPPLRLHPPSLRAPGAGGLLSRSDGVSVGSVSSMSTELSLSNEDALDVTVSSSSSAIVTLETDDGGPAHFSGSLAGGGLWGPLGPSQQQEVDHRQKTAGPLAGFFSRNLFARRVKQPGAMEQKDPGWRLFGRVPPRDGPTKDPRKIQK